MTFEEALSRRIAWLVASASLGCAGGETGPTDTGDAVDLQAMCDGAEGPPDTQVAQGFVTVAPGEDCPPVASAALEVHGCTFLEWQGVTCALDQVDEHQQYVDDGYGGQFVTVEPGTEGEVTVCTYSGVFYLDPNHPTCGRPMAHDGRNLVAETVHGSGGWGGAPGAPVALPAAERARVAQWWAEAAALEHASVASFARFSLDLLRLGAPAALVTAAHQAAIDEVNHAELCFELAQRYAGRGLRPGPLDTSGVLAAARSERDILVGLVEEGCVAETIAAVDAAARQAAATDPDVVRVLGVIVRDESAHAALAWRTLRWALSADPTRWEVVLATFAAARGRAAVPAGGPTVEAHGLIGAGAQQQAVEAAWDVIRASLDALVAERAAAE